MELLAFLASQASTTATNYNNAHIEHCNRANCSSVIHVHVQNCYLLPAFYTILLCCRHSMIVLCKKASLSYESTECSLSLLNWWFFFPQVSHRRELMLHSDFSLLEQLTGSCPEMLLLRLRAPPTLKFCSSVVLFRNGREPKNGGFTAQYRLYPREYGYRRTVYCC